MLIARVGQDEKLTRILVTFLETKTENDQGWNIERDLNTFAKTLLREDSLFSLEKLKLLTIDDFIEISSTLHRQTRSMENKMAASARHALTLIQDNGLQSSDFYQGDKGIAAYFNYIAQHRFDKCNPNTNVLKTIKNDNWYSGKANQSSRRAIDGIKNILTQTLHSIVEISKEYPLFRLVGRNIYSLAVLNEIDKELDEIKLKNNILPVSEFNKRIAAIVMNEPVPFLYERLGEKYRHFLLDEFQDTSILQWQNLLPLLENSLASGFLSLVVGDGKQAIYRWRNGEVEQFMRLPAIFYKEMSPFNEVRERLLQQNFREEKLATNFRSKAEIVDFNNRFFSFISQSLPEKYQSIYREVVQEYQSENTGGRVELHFLPKEDFKNNNLNTLRDVILQCREDGFSYGDIAILCRSNDSASQIARFLIENSINVISSESLLLDASHDVNFIIAFLKHLLLPSDKIAQRAIKEHLVAKGLLNHEKLSAALRLTDFNISHGKLSRLSVYDCCEELIRTFGLNKKSSPHILFFLDAIQQFTLTGKHTISDFLLWWEEKKTKLSVVVPEGPDAVSVMTIHKAKGLEFPVVIYPFAKESRKIALSSFWADNPIESQPQLSVANIAMVKELEETRYEAIYKEEKEKSQLDLVNLVYVAFTRPTHRLYVLTQLPSQNDNTIESVPNMLYRFLKNSELWNENLTSYFFGNAVENDRMERKISIENIDISSFISEAWQQKVVISQSAATAWDVEDPEKNSHWGSLVHYVLSQLQNTETIGETLDTLLSAGIIDTAERQWLLEKIGKIVSHPGLAQFFAEKTVHKIEAAILTRKGKVIRPDRIAISGETTALLDYKTGEPSETHRTQIIEYAEALQEMGYKNIKKYLVYLNDEIKVELVND
jgi:ATP-dependent exoDNAse (exonuclease V) beta subunit